MAQAHAGGNAIPLDVRQWEPDLRRSASLVVLGVAGLFLVASLLFFGLAPEASGIFLWIAIVVLGLLLVAEAAILATGIAREENIGPPWLAEPAATEQQASQAGAPPTAEPAQESVEISLKCPECGDQFNAQDTGERPLHTECPYCGAEGNVDLGPPEHEQEPAHEDPYAGAAEPEPEEPPEDAEALALKCPACDTQFEVTDTGERPLTATCPGCGRGGKLKG